MRREIISNALTERISELCGERIPQLAPEKFGEMKTFVSEVRERMLSASPADIKNSTPDQRAPRGWTTSDTDCLSSLRALCLDGQLQLHSGQQPPIDLFLKALDDSRRHPERRFQILAERYACPLNFTLPAEDEAREHVLTRLMAQTRARIEKDSVRAVDSDDLLLKLNLTALHASLAGDLRFLDALNYYYELLPATWQPHAQHNWLLASYLAFYARALAAWI